LRLEVEEHVIRQRDIWQESLEPTGSDRPDFEQKSKTIFKKRVITGAQEKRFFG
jgi:hypothetical protein